NLLEATRVRDQAALDPYIFVREAFRQRRTFLIYDGNPPSTGIDEFLDEEQMEHGTPGVLKVY
ncbi:MAG: VacJ family lipoprotein, partial [Gammaproteobacteria bacterium]